MKKNKGFSLIELVVVIAIMALLMTGVAISIFSQQSWKCRQAKDEVCTYLQQTRAEALAKTGAWVEICYEDGQCVVKPSYAGDQKLGESVRVFYYSSADGGATPIEIDSSHSLVLTYSRGTGAFQTMKTKAEKDASGNITYTEAGPDVYCQKIRITGVDGVDGYTITLYKETGKYDCVKE